MTQARPLSQASKDGATLLALIRLFVDWPDAIELKTFDGGGSLSPPKTVWWRLSCRGEDMPKIIGSNGTHARAIKHLFAAIGHTHGARYLLDIEEPEDQEVFKPFKPIPAKKLWEPAVGEPLLDVLAALGLQDFDLDISQYPPNPQNPYIAVKMAIHCQSQESKDFLLKRDRSGVTLVGDLGCLFRAVGLKMGVELSIAVL